MRFFFLTLKRVLVGKAFSEKQKRKVKTSFDERMKELPPVNYSRAYRKNNNTN